MPVTEETYSATVTANNDDEQRGRIRIACAQLLGDEESELPMWVEPVLDWGFFLVPDVGEVVEIIIITGSDEDEVRGQMSIDNLDIRWRGARFYTDDVPKNTDTAATPVHPDFKENYGKRRGFSTPFGHILMFDDDENSPTVQFTFSKSKPTIGVPILPTDISRLEFEKDGSLKITLLDKNVIHFQTEGKKLIIEIDNGASVEVSGKNSDTVTTLGDGSVSAAIAEHLKTYIDNSVKTIFDSHTHPDAMGGTGAPTTLFPNYDTSITSSKLKLPDG